MKKKAAQQFIISLRSVYKRLNWVFDLTPCKWNCFTKRHLFHTEYITLPDGAYMFSAAELAVYGADHLAHSWLLQATEACDVQRQLVISV